MNRKSFVPSALVAACAAAAPAMVADAATVVYGDQASFDANVIGSLVWSEDFESFDPGVGGANALPTPQVGLGDGSVTMSSSSTFLAAFGSGYTHNSSTIMGVVEDTTATLTFAGGVDSVGMEMYGTSTFIAGYFDAIQYTVYDLGGGVLASGALPSDGSSPSAYFGIVSDTPIGSVDFAGTQFDVLGSQILADNVRGFVVPAPGIGTLLGVAGIAACRRRRR